VCDALDVLEEPDAKAAMVWIVGEYAERIDNADELLAFLLDNFLDEPVAVQLQLLTATVKLFLKKPAADGAQAMISSVLTAATQQTDNPDLRDRAYIYWRMLSAMPAARVAALPPSAVLDGSDTLLRSFTFTGVPDVALIQRSAKCMWNR
jgi:AP-1 complex subunit beta-1